jgi:hypothetical protein
MAKAMKEYWEEPGASNQWGEFGSTTITVLTEAQRGLVAGNLGLVALHLRRNVRNLSVPRRDREWDDLFQEGCLGLIQAALLFRKERGIAFAAFALPRIHNAVSRALQRKFRTIYIPPKRAARRSGAAKKVESDSVSMAAPQVHSFPDDAERTLPDRRGPTGDQTIESHRDRETIGDRLRGKYERALADVCAAVARGASKRGDRAELVQTLMRERFLIPHDEAKRPMRQIARDTGSSYARVAQCDKQIEVALRDTLGHDPEFGVLYRRARVDPEGVDVDVDDQMERELAQVSANTYADRLRRADPLERAGLLREWETLAKRDIGEMTRSGVLSLSSRDRERLLRRRDGRTTTQQSPRTTRSAQRVTGSVRGGSERSGID